MNTTYTPAEIVAKLTPCIGDRLSGVNKWHADIICGLHHRINADIREITDEGVLVVWGSSGEVIPFASITQINIKHHWFWLEQQARDRKAAA